MKKFIALLLSLAMVLSLCSLTACGKRGGEDDTNKEGETADAEVHPDHRPRLHRGLHRAQADGKDQGAR